jgi:PAS domain S-box-containing protein
MMWLWSDRPRPSHLGLFVTAYVLGCGFAQSLAIVPGTGISIWPPAGLFIATLASTSRRTWPWWIVAGCLGELVGNLLWFESPLLAALLMYAGNALEAVVGGWLVNRFCGRPVKLETLREVLVLVLLGAGVAPLFSATVGAATVSSFGMQAQTFAGAWPLWWIGDATGVLIVAPLALALFQSWREKARLSATRWIEAGALAVIFLGVAALSLSGYLPFAYVIMPPLLWAAVRFEFRGAAIALALLALITALFTISGASEFAGDATSRREKHIMLQLFLAISAFSALIVAAIARQYQLAMLTLRKNMETLRERERELRELVDVVPVAIARMANNGDPTFFNKRMIDFLGLELTDLDEPGSSRRAAAIATALHPDDEAGFVEAFDHSLATGESFSRKYRLRRGDGVYRWVEGRIEPLRNRDGVVVQWYGVAADIDDQMRLYSEVAERESRIRRLIDSDIIGIVIWDLDGRLIEANDAFLRMVQYEREDVRAGLGWFEMTPPEWQEVHAREEAAELAATGMMQAREKEYFRKDGTRVPVLIGAACFEGQSRQGVAYILDLTEQKLAEAALRDRERELSQLVDMVPSHLWRITPDGVPVFFNRRLVDFLGFDVAGADKPGGSRLAAFIEAAIHPEDAASVAEAFDRSLASGDKFSMKWRMRRVDGVYRWMAASAEAMRDRDGKIAQWYGLCHDIDDQVRAEEELLRTQDRLGQASQAASLAELSASIAHEVNQPLAAVVTNSHACQRWLTAEPPNLERAQRTVDRIIRDANAAADVVSRIRALFKQTVQTRSTSTLGAVMAEVRRLMLDEASKHGVIVDSDVDADLPAVSFDRVQIQQVLVNLMRNAVEAMETVSGPRKLSLRARKNGSAVEVEVIDTGVGLEHPERIFTPFFSTKESGMGMGLAISRSIVESHGGRLWAEANANGGSTFAFTLPIQAEGTA